MDLTKQQDTITLRAHHGMCLSYFEGKGYSNAFSAHMAQVLSRLEADPSQRIRVMADTDVICSACPNLQGGICTCLQKVSRYDRMVLIGCGIPEDQLARDWAYETTYEAFREAVRSHILDAGRRREICGDCQWDDICTAAEEARRK